MNSKYKRLLSDTALFALGNFGAKFILFFLVPLYTNVLTTAEYGTADLINSSVNLLFPFLTLSINDALLRFCLDKSQKPKCVLWQSIYVLFFSTVLTVCIYPIIIYLNVFNGYNSYFLVMALLYPYRSALSLYLKAINKVKLYALDNIIYTCVLCVANIVFLLVFRKGLNGYLLSQIIAMISSIVFIVIAEKTINFRDVDKLDVALLKRMLAYSVPMIANAVSWWAINSSDRYMIKIMINDSSVGIYSVATKMPSLLTSITSVFYQAWLISSIVEYENGKDKRFYENVFSLYTIILTLGSSICLLVLKPFMRVYVGADFAESWQYVPVLLMAAIFSTFANFFFALYKSAMKNVREVLATTLGALTNIIVNLVLIPFLGIQGACVATLVCELFMAIFVIVDTRRFFAFNINFPSFIVSIIFVMVQSFVLVVINNQYLVYSISICSLIILLLIHRSQLRYFASYVLKKHSRGKSNE